MFGKYNPGDWSLTPELQKKFEEVQAQTRRLQAEFGITPMTLEERAAAYQKRKAEEAQAKKMLGQRRPPPKWKV
jgi:hypothetical protein